MKKFYIFLLILMMAPCSFGSYDEYKTFDNSKGKTSPDVLAVPLGLGVLPASPDYLKLLKQIEMSLNASKVNLNAIEQIINLIENMDDRINILSENVQLLNKEVERLRGLKEKAGE